MPVKGGGLVVTKLDGWRSCSACGRDPLFPARRPSRTEKTGVRAGWRNTNYIRGQGGPTCEAAAAYRRLIPWPGVLAAPSKPRPCRSSSR